MVTRGKFVYKGEEVEVPSAFVVFLNNFNNLDPLIDLQENHLKVHASPEPFFYSAIVTLATYWEVFCTDLIKEATFVLSHYLDDHEKLPMELKKEVSKELKSKKHELSAWKLADTNWKGYLYSRVQDLEDNPNEFKSARPQNIEQAIQKFLGYSDLSDLWDIQNKSEEETKETVNNFLDDRNDIVHRGILLSTKMPNTEYLVTRKEMSVELAHTFLKYFDRKFNELIGIRFYENEKALELDFWPFPFLNEKNYT